MKKTHGRKKLISLVITVIVFCSMFVLQVQAYSTKNFSGKVLVENDPRTVTTFSGSADYNIGVIVSTNTMVGSYILGTPYIRVCRSGFDSDYQSYSYDDIMNDVIKFFPEAANGNKAYTVEGMSDSGILFTHMCCISGQVRYM